MKEQPKITVIPVDSTTVTSDDISLANFGVVSFIVGTAKKDGTATITIKANTEGGTAKAVPFLYKKNEDKEFSEATAEGVTVTQTADDAEVFIAMITDRMLAHDELDRVSITVEASDADTLATLYAFQTCPRYSDADE